MEEPPDRLVDSWTWEPEKKLVRSVSMRLGALMDYVIEARRRSQTRAVRMLEVAVDHAGGEEQLLASLTGRESRLRLLEQAILAAEASRLDAKVNAIGRALASGALAEGDSSIDEHGIIISVIADLEMPHIRALQALSISPYNILQMSEHLQTSTMLAHAIIATLRRHGLAFDGGVHLSPIINSEGPILDFENRRDIELSSFGERLLDYLVESSAT